MLVWQADSFDEWTFPDPTMGGLLPGMTDAALKDLFNMQASHWKKKNLFFDEYGAYLYEY